MLIVQIDVQTECKFWIRISDNSPVEIIDHAIFIYILKNEIACMRELSRLLHTGSRVLVGFINAQRLESIKLAEWQTRQSIRDVLADHGSLRRILVAIIIITIQNRAAVCSIQIGDQVTVKRTGDTNTVIQFFKSVTVSNQNVNTLVTHRADIGIDISESTAHGYRKII